MGIYLFNRDTLVEVPGEDRLSRLRQGDFSGLGREPSACMVHLFDGYWEDIGTIKAFYDANLSLASANPPFDFHSPAAPIYSRPRFLPPTRWPTAYDQAQPDRRRLPDRPRLRRSKTA